MRLLSRETPDLEGSKEAIDCMISDAMRASEVIKRIRALLKKTAPERIALYINETIRDVIALSASELATNKVSLRTELGGSSAGPGRPRSVAAGDVESYPQQ